MEQQRYLIPLNLISVRCPLTTDVANVHLAAAAILHYDSSALDLHLDYYSDGVLYAGTI